VIIGKGGENISRDDALRHVAGYSCYMDGSARDWQHTWFTAGKNWRQTGAFGRGWRRRMRSRIRTSWRSAPG
jgi:2-keto-4-pentenoate hydratase/2-oxohepta-3-ene-1,7-dioic acid hydratase in catechol pathway